MSAAPELSKEEATVLAEAALLGIAAVRMADGTYIATWRGWLKPCPDIAAVRMLIQQLSGHAN